MAGCGVARLGGHPGRQGHPRVTTGTLRGKVTRYRKLDRVPVEPSTALVCDDLDEHADDDGMQGPSLQGVARMLEDMEISPSLT